MTFHALNGLNACIEQAEDGTCMFDPSTDSYTQLPTSSSSSFGTSAASNASMAQAAYNQQYPTSGNASTGFNWGLLAPLFGAAGAIGSGYAASELKPGQSMQTAGTTIVGAGQALPGSTISGGLNLSGLMMPLLIGGGLLVLVMTMSKGGR